MAQFIIEIPDNDDLDFHLNNFARNHNYIEMVEDQSSEDPSAQIPNPQTKLEFMGEKVIKFIQSAIEAGDIQEFDEQKQDRLLDTELKTAKIIVISEK